MMSPGKAGLVFLLAFCALFAAGEEADLSFFPFVKTVRMPSVAVQGGMGGVIELDTEVLGQVRNPLRECRVFTDAGDPVKFAVRRREGEVRRTRLVPVEAELVMTSSNSGIIRMAESLPGGAYCLEILPENPYFAKFLCINAKLPSGKVRKVLEKASVFAFAPPYPVTRNMVEFYIPTDAELQVSWQKGAEIPQKILRPDDTIPESWGGDELVNVRIRLFRKETETQHAPLLRRYDLKCQTDHTETSTIYSMESARVPVTGFRMQTKTPFLFRQAKIYGGSSPLDLKLIAEGTFARIAPADQLFVPVPESRFRYYEVHVDNRDKSPLDDVEWSVESPRMELVTEPPAGNLLKLAYGRQTVAGAFPRRLPEKQVPCLVGQGRRNPVFVPPSGKSVPLFWYWLDGAVVLAAGGIAACCIILTRRRKKGGAA